MEALKSLDKATLTFTFDFSVVSFTTHYYKDVLSTLNTVHSFDSNVSFNGVVFDQLRLCF